MSEYRHDAPGGLRFPAALYDERKCIEILMNQGMEEDEAWDYFSFNVQGAWMGEDTPIFIVN